MENEESTTQLGSQGNVPPQQAAQNPETTSQVQSGDSKSKPIGELLADSGKHLTDEVRKNTKKITKDVSKKVNELAHDKQGAAADLIRTISEAAASGAELLEERGYGTGSHMVSVLADEIGAFADEISDHSPREIFQEVSDIARRHPGITLAGGLIVGFAVMRLLTVKDEAEDGEEEEEDDDDDDSEGGEG